ncbi:MAG TPA: single-stranded-DNA-specific exonuclease RecJ [Clostridiales bacterium]|nr:single-stranded-DNA-specific exonuclease RecJ [Clostridiales bacterium]
MLLTAKKWHTAASLSSKDTDLVLDTLLKSRGIETPEQREKFLAESDGVWHDPFLFADMDVAVDTIVSCISSGGHIVVYGDYDCDGVTATAILIRYLRSHDVSCSYIVPHRAEHGYGLTDNIIDKVLDEKPDLLITVDCGITNCETIEKIRARGIKVIVTDHHNVKENIPVAEAVICAKREDNTYPFRDLCGAGVAMKLVEALGRDGRYKVTARIWKQAVELAGLATIADLVSVVDENRTIIKKAFLSMRDPVNPGVRIMNSILLENKKLDESYISFNFVPRINAAGRLYDSSDALKLFLSDDEREVRNAALELGKQNDERKKIEAEVFSEAVAQIEDPSRPEEWSLTNTVGPIVVYGPNWHQGVLGIVAGKLSQYYRRSAIVFTDDTIDKDNIKGSGRAFGEFDLYSSLEKMKDYLVNFGGHKKAAGMVVARDRIGSFMKKLEENSRRDKEENAPSSDDRRFEDEDTLEISLEIPFEQIDLETYEAVSVFKPFGIGNKKPVFATRDLLITDIQGMSDGLHMRMELSDGKGNSKVSAVGFNMGQYLSILKVGDRVDIAYTLNEYTYKNNTSVSLYLEDIVPVTPGGMVWDKASTAEELYGSSMPLTEIAKFARCDLSAAFVPSKEDYASCYKVLKQYCAKGITTADTVLLAKLINVNSSCSFTPFKVRRCLDVFSEAGLIKLGVVDSSRVCFRFLENDRKVPLSSSPTYVRFSEYG